MKMPSKGRILLADDEAFFVESLAERLRQEGYECVARGDGLQVAAELNTATYDLLIADIRMPGNANLEMIRLLPKLDDAVLAILVTAFPEHVTSVKWPELPVLSCLAKPVQFPELLDHVRRGVAHSILLRCNRAIAQRLADWVSESRGHEQLMLRKGASHPVNPQHVADAVARSLTACLADLNVMLDKLAANGAIDESTALRRSIPIALRAFE